MGVRKDNSKSGKWLAEFYKDGKRIRKWFLTKGEASRFYRLNANKDEQIDDSEVINNQPAETLSFFVQQWYELHGQTLKDGENRLQKLLNLCRYLGDPLANSFTTEDFAEYRQLRLAGKFSQNPKRPPTQATINREHSYLRAVFNELKYLGKWKKENPLAGIRQFKEKDAGVTYLKAPQIKRLLEECDRSRNPDLKYIVRICLATGARWSEAEKLEDYQLMPFKVTYINTKSNKNRTVPISPELYNMLPIKKGRIFGDAYESFADALERAKIKLPKGQRTHVLRHTFASHFMMNGGNILVLKDILGHSTLNMTMRYAHFAPDYLDTARSLNPLNGI
ncbi:tyrosine-type recombinase/integrase [Gallibacterium sp. AGMB14963]|uniref:phage integrase n=1 Tax=Gallibacterium faecale TaxID=3019086 RepID=UPI0022F15DA7|nr:tyrosine-type recombinase/integrase [Gallibacterium sp. AGMB14963]MDA3979466.1 tyrosine-type recombinase/integrase [Gallibacterium sp. AGMB14963]